MTGMTLEEVIAAGERLDSNDTAVALRLARAATDSEVEAWDLMAHAQERAEALVVTEGFQVAVRAVAEQLLARRELSGTDLELILKETRMAKAATRDEQTYECCVAHAITLDGTPRVVRNGERVRGDDPAYVTNPGFFCVAGAPHGRAAQRGGLRRRRRDDRAQPDPVRLPARLARPSTCLRTTVSSPRCWHCGAAALGDRGEMVEIVKRSGEHLSVRLCNRCAECEGRWLTWHPVSAELASES